MKIPDKMRVRKSMCATCVFRAECEGGIPLQPGRREQIRRQSMKGVAQICHHDDNKTLCRGARDFQLHFFYRRGIIAAPTDKALAEAMRAVGIQPRKHIAGAG